MAYLQTLDIQRPAEAPAERMVLVEPSTVTTPVAPKPTAEPVTNKITPLPRTGTAIDLPPVSSIELTNGYRFVASDTQYVVLAFTGVDPLYLGEARNALNR
ncbi:MAG: hypothetical protein EAZ62_07970, partial [Sphingobacteriia bacterium]